MYTYGYAIFISGRFIGNGNFFMCKVDGVGVLNRLVDMECGREGLRLRYEVECEFEKYTTVS
jgi:hypothetical protein